jgi:hypothetical protein
MPAFLSSSVSCSVSWTNNRLCLDNPSDDGYYFDCSGYSKGVTYRLSDFAIGSFGIPAWHYAHVGLVFTFVSAWIFARNIVLQVVNGFFLSGDDPFHQVSD